MHNVKRLGYACDLMETEKKKIEDGRKRREEATALTK